MPSPPSSETPLLLTLRRMLLLAAQDGSLAQERVDGAELARALGLDDAARAIYDILFVRTGFAPRQRRWHGEVAASTGLWGEPPAGASEPTAAGFAVDVALAELKHLMAVDADRSRPEPPWPDVVTAGIAEAAPDPVPAAGDLFAATARLRTLLEGELDEERTAELSALTEALRLRVATASPTDGREDISDPERLAEALVAADLRRFLLDNAALAHAPFGSAPLLHAAARLEPAALGPYLGSVGRLVRSSRDVPALVRLAGGGDLDEARFDRWTALLSLHLDLPTLLDLIDELGDRRMMRPLWPLLYLALDGLRRRGERAPFWRIRDAALDTGDWRLAAAAQEALALAAARDPVEWRILSEIHLTAGDTRGARLALLRGRRALGPDPELLRRLKLIRSGAFEQFVLAGGFGTPLHRRTRRQARPAAPEPA